MSEIHPHSGPSHIEYGRGAPRPSGIIVVGAGMGVASAFIGLAIFLAACFGLEGSFLFAPIPFILGAVGLIICIVGTVIGKGSLDDTQVLGALFVCLFGIIGGLLEMSVRYKWPIFG
jgi:hypothetical protein